MSLDRSLKSASSLVRHRNVLTRDERLAQLKDEEKWSAGKSVFGLPKVGHRKAAVGKAVKEEGEEAQPPPPPRARALRPQGRASAKGGAAPAAPAAKAAAPAAKRSKQPERCFRYSRRWMRFGAEGFHGAWRVSLRDDASDFSASLAVRASEKMRVVSISCSSNPCVLPTITSPTAPLALMPPAFARSLTLRPR